MTPAQIAALRIVCDTIVEAIAAAGPTGAPAGPLYAALQTKGCSLSQFEAITGALVSAGKIRKSGNLFFVI